MAFFNLTKLGVQDPIASAVKENTDILKVSNSTNLNSKPEVKQINHKSGSYVKYTEKLTKHQRSSYDPNEIYVKPVTSSQDYGWWKKDGAPENLPWTKVGRCARVNSEMTRFVDEMTLTNKHFTLF